MFTKKPESDAKLSDEHNEPGETEAKPTESRQPALSRSMPSARDAAGAGPSLIGQDLTIEGNIISKGEVHVDGEVQGDIHCVSLIIGEKAQVSGSVLAEDVIVRGRVEGELRGTRLSLQATSHVEGDIIHKSLVIEQGAYFEGKSRREEDPGRGSSDKSGSSSGSSSSKSQSSRAAE